MSRCEPGDKRINNRPPVSGQFKPGQSGHRLGRPPGSRNARKIVEDEVHKSVTITERGQPKRKSKFEVMFLQQVHKAMAGDLRSAKYVTEVMARHGLLTVPETEAARLTVSESIVFEELTQRIRDSLAQPDDADEVKLHEHEFDAVPMPKGVDP